jgi:hypothetical protein
MMASTPILLDSHVLRRARQRASDQGISVSEYVRRLVEADLGRPPAVRTPSTVFNLGNSGGSNIAAAKDRMIGEAVAAPRAKRPRRRPE